MMHCMCVSLSLSTCARAYAASRIFERSLTLYGSCFDKSALHEFCQVQNWRSSRVISKAGLFDCNCATPCTYLQSWAGVLEGLHGQPSSVLGQVTLQCSCKFIMREMGIWYPQNRGESVFGSIVISVPACHAEGPGSIPGQRVWYTRNGFFQTHICSPGNLLLHIASW